MARASVLIPTHERAETIAYAVTSVQAQGIDDIEILIVGDGVNDALRAVIERLKRDDPRIRFFDFPKGPRHGEIHRDVVLRQAKGRIVCYLADDDLWLSGHLREMEAVLQDADFATAMQVVGYPDGPVRGYFFDLNRPEFFEPWLAWRTDPIGRLGRWTTETFGFSVCAHRLDAYLRLPEGWATTPPVPDRPIHVAQVCAPALVPAEVPATAADLDFSLGAVARARHAGARRRACALERRHRQPRWRKPDRPRNPDRTVRPPAERKRPRSRRTRARAAGAPQ